MFANFHLDALALETDPNLAGLSFDPGLHAPSFEDADGQQIYALVTSRFGVAALLGAIIAAPLRPPVLALEPLLFNQVGAGAFTNEQKKLTGRIVRFVIEHLGGRWVRRGIKISGNSRYGSGSIYTFSHEHSLEGPAKS